MEDYPSYLSLFESGELQRRADEAVRLLRSCRVCPWNCNIDRLADERKVCRTGRWAQVSSFFAHLGEETPLRGSQGSGTIFFSGCNLRCVFCQNYDISQGRAGMETRPQDLAGMMIKLQDLGCHNINFVTPEHVVPQILEALPLAISDGLKLPLVYNTSAYDSMKSLRALDGIVDIYMPDFKYWTEEKCHRYLKAPDYSETAQVAIKEMHRQVGDLELDSQGLARRGLLVRHLVMPGELDETKSIMNFLAKEISPDTYVNIMGQYHPSGKVTREKYAEIDRCVTMEEMEEAYSIAREAGLHRFDERMI